MTTKSGRFAGDTVAVTGGGGFLGTAICRRLLEEGATVRSLSRSQYDHLRELGVEQRETDIGDAKAVAAGIAGSTLVFHCAARASLWGSYNSFFRTNVVGTTNVIAACHRHGVERIVHTSSPSVIAPHVPEDGKQVAPPEEFALAGVDETHPFPDLYLAHYPHTKAQAERTMLAAVDDDAMRIVAIRPPLIWGPGDNHLFPRLTRRARKKKLRVVGTGENTVDSIYIDNAAEAHLRAAESLEKGSPTVGRVYFISNDEPMSMQSLMDRMLAAAGLPPVDKQMTFERAFQLGRKLEKLWGFLRLKSEPPMTRFLAHQLATEHWFSIDAAKRDFGYEPRVSIDEGMERLASWAATR